MFVRACVRFKLVYSSQTSSAVKLHLSMAESNQRVIKHSESTERALREHSESTQKALKIRVISSEPKILRLVVLS